MARTQRGLFEVREAVALTLIVQGGVIGPEEGCARPFQIDGDGALRAIGMGVGRGGPSRGEHLAHLGRCNLGPLLRRGRRAGEELLGARHGGAIGCLLQAGPGTHDLGKVQGSDRGEQEDGSPKAEHERNPA